ncbi:MAG TPA: thermonuclease family protein [Pyrinomonadaceae bacterium]
MKEIILSIALLLSFSLWAEGQSNDAQSGPMPRPLSFEHEDECGSPLRESMLWMSVEGKVIRVVDGDTIILLIKDNKRKRINLAAVDASAGQDAARSLLSGLVMNRPISVLVNPSNIKSGLVVGAVHAQEKDVNRELLEAGVVRYHEPKSYSVSRYTACVYRIVEREAREAKRGLWLNASR